MVNRILNYAHWIVTLAASCVAVIAFFFPPTPTTLSGIERALTNIANKIPEVTQQDTDQTALSRIVDSSARIASSSIRELSEADAVMYRVTEGVFDLRPLETIEVKSPSGRPIPLSLTTTSSPNSYGRVFYFDGQTHKLHIGNFLEYANGAETCRLLFVSGLEASAVRLKWDCF